MRRLTRSLGKFLVPVSITRFALAVVLAAHYFCDVRAGGAQRAEGELGVELNGAEFVKARDLRPRVTGAAGGNAWVPGFGVYSRFQVQVLRNDGKWEPTYELDCLEDFGLSPGKDLLADQVLEVDWRQVPTAFTSDGMIVGPGKYRLSLAYATPGNKGASRCQNVASSPFYLRQPVYFRPVNHRRWTDPVLSNQETEVASSRAWTSTEDVFAGCPKGLSLDSDARIKADDNLRMDIYVSGDRTSFFNGLLVQRKLDDGTWTPGYKFECSDVFGNGLDVKHVGDQLRPHRIATRAEIGQLASYQAPGTYRYQLVYTATHPEEVDPGELSCCVLTSPEFYQDRLALHRTRN
jgi:hypothetical protein